METDSGRWLIDTGAPVSIGTGNDLSFGGRSFPLKRTYLGSTVAGIAGYVGQPMDGLVGMDVLRHFDFWFSVPGKRVLVSRGELPPVGSALVLLGTGPHLIDAPVNGQPCRWFFDTGAPVSYLERDSLRLSFPQGPAMADFFPGVGRFATETHLVEVELGWQTDVVSCGKLPEVLAGMVVAFGADGILGSQILSKRLVGYFPRRHQLSVGANDDRG